MKKLNLILLFIVLLPNRIVFGQYGEYDDQNREPIYYTRPLEKIAPTSYFGSIGQAEVCCGNGYDYFVPLDSVDKSLTIIKRLMLIGFRGGEDKINFSLYPNLEELILYNCCRGLDSTQLKDLKKIRILKIFQVIEPPICDIDWHNSEAPQDYLLFNTTQQDILPELKEMTIYSYNYNLNYINESFWANKNLKRVYSTDSFFYPLGYLLRFDLKKSNHLSYNVYDTTQVSYIEDVKGLYSIFLDSTAIPRNGKFEAYYPDSLYQVFFEQRKLEKIYNADSTLSIYSKLKDDFNVELYNNRLLYMKDTIYKKNLRVIGEFKNSLLDGKWSFFYEDGKLAEERYYEDGKEVGKWVHFAPNLFCYPTWTGYNNVKIGKKMIECEFKNGALIDIKSKFPEYEDCEKTYQKLKTK